MNFDQRVALITGGTGALGSAVTQAFLESGGRVLTTYHHATAFDELQNKLPEAKTKLAGVQADVTSARGVDQAVAQTLAQFGRIDVLINLVGGYAGGVNVADLAEKDWDHMLSLNLKSVFLTCRAVLPHMLKNGYGRIVNISSRGAVEVGAGASAYAVAKAGVITLTKALAQEVKGKNVTANVVLPGMIDTPANRRALPGADPAKFVKPGSIARVILFLAGAEAAELSGAAIPVYGAG